MDEKILRELGDVESRVGRLSSAEKILLTTDGSVTNILDVLKGRVSITTLVQEFIPASCDAAGKLDIGVGEFVNYRVVLMGTSEPLIHAVSLTPLSRLDDDFKEDLIRADIPIGRILRKHGIESRREIKSVFVEEPSSELIRVFKTESLMLTRTYQIIHDEQILIWLKETFPYNLF